MVVSFGEWITIAISIIGCLFAYAFYVNGFFKRRNIEYLKPIPFFGNTFKIFIYKEHMIDFLKEIYQTSKNRYIGIFNFLTPIVVLNDIELIKKVMIKDFDHFMDHMEFTDEHVDPYFGRNLFSLKGDKWREMRNTLSPAFTSSKMRGMIAFIDEIGKELSNHLKISLKDGELKEFDVKDLSSRYSNDVIASCAFGFQTNSLKEKNNDFYTFAKSFTDFNLISTLKTMLFMVFPYIVRLLGITVSDSKSTSFFHKIFVSNMKEREEGKIERPDMIHLLMLAKQGALRSDINEDDGPSDVHSSNKIKKTKWTDEELTAQALIFIFAGFDTVSTALSFLLYELAVNQDVQEKLREEIASFMKENNGKIDYNNLSKLKYLDMTVTESLRLWPPIILLDRVCVKPYTIPPQNDSSKVSHKINPGEVLWIPVYNIHRDPKYYPDPNKFDPERFSDENKSSIDMNTYMPFGAGPRICIGSRFALMEMKVFLIYLLYNFEVQPSANTVIPMKLQPHFFDYKPLNGHRIGIKKRN